MFHKLSFLCSILLLLNLSLRAQTTIGIRAGGISSSVRSGQQQRMFTKETGQHFSDLLSYHVGISFQHRLSSDFSIDTDLTFAKKGHRLFEASNVQETESRVLRSYLNLPVHLQYRPGGGKLAVSLGGQFSYRVDEKLKAGETIIDTEDQWESSEVTVDFGLVYFLREDLKFFLNYQLGISPIGKIIYTDVNGMPLLDYQFYSRAIELSVYHYLL